MSQSQVLYKYPAVPCGFRPLPRAKALFRGFYSKHAELRLDTRQPVQAFSRLLGVLCPLLTSQVSSHRLSTIVVPISWTILEISPGNAHTPSHLCLPHLLICLPGKYWTLAIIGTSSGRPASYGVFVHQASVLLWASSRHCLTTLPLPFS